MICAIFNFGNTLTDTCRNCSSVYGGRCSRRNRDCNGFDSRVISLQAAITLAPLILKSYCFLIWSTLICPLSVKLSNFSWNCFDILSNSSMQIILGLFSSRMSKIRFVVLLPSKYTPFLYSIIPNRKSVFALAGGPMNSKL
jgi:hypothetical protein